MRLALIFLLAAALLSGCVQGSTTGQTGDGTGMQGTDNVSEGTATAPPQEGTAGSQEEVAEPPPAVQGDVLLTASVEEIELSTLVSEVRVPNPECYPDAEKCGMMDEPMHIFEEKVDNFYNVSSAGESCLLAPSSADEGDTLYLVEFSFDNQDSAAHTVEPYMLRIETEEEDQYLVTSPRSGSACASFVDEAALSLDAGESSGKLKAIVTVPDSQIPLSAVYVVDGINERSVTLG